MMDQRDTDADPIATLAAAVEAAGSVLVLSGSGLSADSGVPTFRDARSGLWANHRPEDVATPEAFERDPVFVWQWYRERRRMAATVEPNAGHRALAGLERCLPELRLVTQNVDGLHQRAGHRDVIEFHGNLHANRCYREGRRVEVEDDTEAPPACPHCGGPVRPDVVWFGEMLPPGALERAVAAAGACDLFVAVGTAAEVHPAAGLADTARRHGARIAEINPGDTALSADVDLCIAKRAAQALPRVLAALNPR